MNHLIQCKTTTLPLLITDVLGCFGLFAKARAVVPPPDGGYPGFNTAEGQNALFSLTTGQGNTAVGWFSLFSNADRQLQHRYRRGTLLFNTADENTAFGAAALLFNTDGINNTAVGTAALLNNTIAEENTATGAFALLSNTTGDFNTATGAFALYFNTTGERNTAMGDSALYLNTEGSRNTAIGNTALLNNTTGDDNTANGVGALRNNTTGIVNTAAGSQALASNTDGTSNTATGVDALHDNTSGGGNTATGFQALLHNDSGDYNTAIGLFALGSLTTGFSNTGLGRSAGTSVTTADHVICIGDNVSGANVSNSCYIGSIFGQTSSGGAAVFINNSGKLGTSTSSRRFKEEIKRMDTASEALFALQPVTFRYKKEVDSDGIPQFGLVAEDVEKVNPALIVRDKEGKPYSVRYDQVNAMLLNEFLKEHRKNEQQESKIEEQEAKIARQEQQIEALTAGLQKVSAEIELSKTGTQTALNNQ